ncbi:MAG: prohead protease/major capsid protein fusion protein [Flavobacteriales bacterium]
MTNQPEILIRTIELASRSIVDTESRLVRLSFSSEEPVTRQSFFSDPWIEILGHERSEVDLSRLNNSAPVLYNHDRSERENRIGVVERAWVENGRGYADIRISRRDEVAGLWQDITDGILRNVSVAYRILERKLTEESKDKPATYRVIRWMPMEISLVDIPADATVGIGRKLEAESLASQPQPTIKETTMPEAVKETGERAEVTLSHTPPVDVHQVRQEALNAEKARRTEIRTLFEKHGDQDKLRDQCLDNPEVDIHEARKLLLESLGKREEPVTSHQRIEIGETDVEKFSRAAEDAISFRAGIAGKDVKPTELMGYTLLEMARKSLELRGVRTAHMDKRELAARAFTHSSSDFPKILENNARKAMLRGYDEAEEVFPLFTRAGNLTDFKTHSRVGLGVFDTLDVIPESGEFKHGTIGERAESIKLATYGKLFSITRQAIINDDLNAFTDIPRKMGRAAARTVGDLVFSILTSNPTMSDGVALFHATHNNLAGSGTAITAASVGAGRTAMRLQKDGKAVLNIRPSYLIVPAAQEDTARVLMTSETDPSKTNSRVPNPVRSAAEVIVDARLDAASTLSWYLAADPNVFDTIEVGYLDGIAAPFLDQQDGWTIDGVEYKVRIDAAAAPLEFRTLYKNPGA